MHICKWPNRLRFFAEVNTKLQQFKDHNSGRKHGSWANGHIFSSTFSDLFVTFTSKFESTQNLFSSSIWYVEYLNIWPKATDSESWLYLSIM